MWKYKEFGCERMAEEYVYSNFHLHLPGYQHTLGRFNPYSSPYSRFNPYRIQ